MAYTTNKSTSSDEYDLLERKLANRLRTHCTPWGVEKNIYESAEVLVEIGRLYLKKALAGEGIHQKIDFIKSVALLAGARVRYEKLRNASKIEMARDAFDEMGDALLETFDASFKRAGILQDLSDQTVEKTQPFREEQKKFCKENLFPIPDDLPEDILHEEQEKKIDLISNLMEQSTGTYTAMMKGLSQCSLKILGPPPCKFALVGLGSLARAEVTLYSDFEHVIVLENFKADEQDKLEKAKEYFRWYSVVFQVIVIGMGETLIPSVGVKSLNDLYSTDESKNWFFDAVTPSGISFDGRFPHASKTPLGKQEASEHRKHVVELIQTINEMLKFLESAENIKNGYHLTEMLLQTCYVDGNVDVYDEFQDGVSAFVRSQDYCAYILEKMQFVGESEDFFLNGNYDSKMFPFPRIKNVFYRPISTIASCLTFFWFDPRESWSFASLHWKRAQFETLRRKFSVLMLSTDVDTETRRVAEQAPTFIHNLLYALAVACEIRIKLYAESEHQKNATPAEILDSIVSKRCRLRVCRTVLYFWLGLRDGIAPTEVDKELGSDGRRLVLLLTIMDYSAAIPFDKNPSNDVKILRKFVLESDAIEIIQKLFDSDPQGEFFGDHRVAFDFINAAARAPSRESELLKKANIIADQIPIAERSIEYVFIKAICWMHERQYSLAIEIIDKWLQSKQTWNSQDHHSDFIDMMQLKMDCIRLHCPPSELLSYCLDLKREHADPCIHIISDIGLYFAHVRLQSNDKAEAALNEVVALYSSNGKIIPDSLTKFIQKLFLELIDFNFIPCKEACEKILQISSEHIQLFSIGNQQWHAKQYRGISMAKKLSDPSYRIDLALLSQENLIGDHSAHFPKHTLHRIEIYRALLQSLLVVNMAIFRGSMIEANNTLVSIYKGYSEQLCHPLFMESFSGIAKLYVGQRFKLLLPEMYEFADPKKSGDDIPHTTASARAYEQACNQVRDVDMKNGVKTLWRIINNPNFDSVIKEKSCKLLCTVINYSKFPAAVQCVIDNRKNFLSKYLLPLDAHSEGSTSYKLIELYNEALRDYSDFYYEDSAIALWKIIQKTEFDSHLQRKAIMMLQFVVLAVWDKDGYPIIIKSSSVVVNEKEKRPNTTDPTKYLTEEEQEICDNLDYYEILRNAACGRTREIDLTHQNQE